MRALGFVALLAACGSDDTTLRVERQPATLAAATSDGWASGGAVLVGVTGSFSFPQPVSLRISLVDLDADPDAEVPAEPALVSEAMLSLYGTAVATITQDISCQPTFCTAELSITGPGATLMQITALGSDAEEADCFYYAVYEDPDPAAASAGHYEAIEAQQQECQRELFE